MYRYEGADTGLDALKEFSQKGYLSSVPLDVPPQPSPIDAALKILQGNANLVS
jgi:hypothetical protein